MEDAWSFKHKPHKMVKHTQTIRRLLPTNCLSVFDHFVGLALKGLKAWVDKLTVLKLRIIIIILPSGQLEYFSRLLVQQKT